MYQKAARPKYNYEHKLKVKNYHIHSNEKNNKVDLSALLILFNKAIDIVKESAAQ